MSTTIGTGEIWEDNGATCMARVLGNDAANLTQAAVTSITCSVYNLDSSAPSTAVATPTVTISSAVFDTLQTSDARWTLDSTGYNFLFTVPASAFANGDGLYRIEFIFDLASGENVTVVFEIKVHEVYSS